MSGIQMALLGSSAATSNTIAMLAGIETSGDTTWDGYGTSAYSGSPADFGFLGAVSRVTIFGGATLLQCYHLSDSFFGTQFLEFAVSGNQTGTSWASITIDGTSFTKATMGGAGTYNSGGNYTSWSASVSDPIVAFPSTIVFA